MAQLFKSKTIQQFKIMQWLAEQGITEDDIASVKLVSRNLVSVANPAGQYMDVFCAMNGAIRILQVSEEREADLDREWNQCDLMDEEDYYEWYGNLTDDERALIDAWDEAYCSGTQKICEDILAMEARTAAAQAVPANIETEEFEM